MSPTRKSTDSALDVAREALEAGEASYPRYSQRNSPKTYTQPQLFAVLMVRQFRGVLHSVVGSPNDPLLELIPRNIPEQCCARGPSATLLEILMP